MIIHIMPTHHADPHVSLRKPFVWNATFGTLESTASIDGCFNVESLILLIIRGKFAKINQSKVP